MSAPGPYGRGPVKGFLREGCRLYSARALRERFLAAGVLRTRVPKGRDIDAKIIPEWPRNPHVAPGPLLG